MKGAQSQISRAPRPGNARLTKGAAVSVLILQNSALALVMRRTRTHAPPEGMYAPTTAVVLAELLKILVSLVMQSLLEGSVAKAAATLRTEIFDRPWETVKMGVPAALYTIQNLLSYVATASLDGPTYQVLCQSKILITALLSVAVLAKPISARQWRALLLLSSGVAAVQLSGGNGSAAATVAAGTASASAARSVVGAAATLTLCLCSGLAGVYFELVVKGTPASLWVRNVQLSIFGIAVAAAATWSADGAQIAARGFLSGYTPLVWLCVCLHSLGGLAVAVVVKYADNIVKCFATSASIVLSCVVAALVTGERVSNMFAIGASFVLGATFLYNIPAGAAGGGSGGASAANGTTGNTQRASGAASATAGFSNRRNNGSSSGLAVTPVQYHGNGTGNGGQSSDSADAEAVGFLSGIMMAPVRRRAAGGTPPAARDDVA